MPVMGLYLIYIDPLHYSDILCMSTLTMDLTEQRISEFSLKIQPYCLKQNFFQR
jgi:hypothetical protein